MTQSVARPKGHANRQNVVTFGPQNGTQSGKLAPLISEKPYLMQNDRRQTRSALGWLIAMLCSAASSATSADTLVDIYELALENDALLKARIAQYNADIELEKLALAPLLPQARAGYSFTDTETDSTSPNVYIDQETGSLETIDVTSIRKTENDGYDVSLSQTLFDLSAWFGWRAGKESTQQAEANLSAAQQDLIVRVVQAYFGVLRAQDNLRASQAQERAFERQLEQTRQRFEVGLIAITDVYEAEAARDLAQVNRIVDENNVAVAKENLSVLTGQSPGALHELGEEFDPRPPEPADRGAWVDFALANNNQLAAARYAEEAARQNATAFRMGHAPTVTGSYRYQDTETTGSIRQNPESLFNFAPNSEQTNETWQIRFDLPLVAGGAISANRRRAAEQFNAARETRINLSRNTVTQARSLHMTVMSDVSRVNARKQSIVSSQSALDATQAGYEVGTRNIVDVLNAQNKLFAAQRDYANSRYDFVINSLRLKEVAGTLSPEDIARLEGFLLEPAAPTASGSGSE